MSIKREHEVRIYKTLDKLVELHRIANAETREKEHVDKWAYRYIKLQQGNSNKYSTYYENAKEKDHRRYHQ